MQIGFAERCRRAAFGASTGLLLALAVSWPARSQEGYGDPPTRAGRIAGISGEVSLHEPDLDSWEAAPVNYPLIVGDALWTEPQSGAELELGGSRIALDGSTELYVAQLDDHDFAAAQPQGETYFRVRYLAPGDRYEIRTPRGVVRIDRPGRYAVATGDPDQPTNVTVLDGAASISGDNLSLRALSGQTASIAGTDVLQGSVGPAIQDPFVSEMAARDRPHPVPVALPPVVQEMPGWEDLAAYGAWRTNPEYGVVWYPQVGSDWVPYREGHWSYVPPWGWTWIDDDPWGFAPFHYGRWVMIDGRWAWIPVARSVRPAYAPAYAPALVAFFQVSGGGASLGIGVGSPATSGYVGWVPLAPGEAYYPTYHASPRYIQRINVTHVTNVTRIVNNVTITTINNYVNRHAAIVAPASVVAASRPVAPAARIARAQQLASARPIVGAPPVRPASGGSARGASRPHEAAVHTASHAPGPPIDSALFRGGPVRFHAPPHGAQEAASRPASPAHAGMPRSAPTSAGRGGYAASGPERGPRPAVASAGPSGPHPNAVQGKPQAHGPAAPAGRALSPAAVAHNFTAPMSAAKVPPHGAPARSLSAPQMRTGRPVPPAPPHLRPPAPPHAVPTVPPHPARPSAAPAVRPAPPHPTPARPPYPPPKRPGEPEHPPPSQ